MIYYGVENKTQRDLMNKTFSLVCAMLLTILFFAPLTTQNAQAPELTETTFPSSVTLSYGTASGSLDAVVGQDGVSYSVVEEDVNSARTYDNSTLNPMGDGSHLEWDTVNGTGGALHYEGVDEGVPDDANTTFVESILGGGPNYYDNDTYDADDFTFPSGHDVIDEVRVYGVASLVGSDSGLTYDTCVHSGSTLSCGTYQSLSFAYEEYSTTWTTDPDTASAWTDSGIDAVEIGHQLYDPGALNPNQCRGTLVYAQVQSNGPIDDYTVSFDFSFTSINLKYKPVLEVSGFRTGDSENIEIHIYREGRWQTLEDDAFVTELRTVQYPLSTDDVIGGSASVRIVDDDATDNTATTVYIDEIKIITQGQPPAPSIPIKIWTVSEYDMYGNRLLVNVFWHQSGGPEKAYAISKFLVVTINGHKLRDSPITVPLDRNWTYVAVPWSALDGAKNNGSVQAFVLINWTAGSKLYGSEVEEITLDNFVRWVFLLLIFLIAVVLLLAYVTRYFLRREDERQYLRERAEEEE